VDKAGKPVAWQIHKVLNDEARRPALAGLVGAFKTTPTGFPYNPFPFLPMIESFAYPTPSFQVTHTDPMFDVPVGAMRGVGAKDGTFSTERMIDDLAELAGADPLAYRKSLITDKRLLAVLDDVATRGQWGRTLPPRTGQGLAVCIYDTTRIACLAEATVSEDGKITVNRITTAIDPGIVVDPGSVHSQTEGGAIWGLSNFLHGKIDVVGGGTAQANLDTTHFFRINEAPRVDVAVLSTDNTPGAVGEPGSFIVYGAVGNAVSRASGVKQYRYPFNAVDLIPNPNPS